MSDIAPTSSATPKTAADYINAIDTAVGKLAGGDETKKKELFREVSQIIAGANVKVTRGDVSGATDPGDKKTSGATGAPALDNPDDVQAKEANLEKLLAYLQLDNEQRQTEMAKDRIELQKESLDKEHDSRMKEINKSIQEMKKAERAQLASRIFGWIGAVIAIAAAVALTIVTGGVAAGFAIAGAVLAVTSLVLNETGAMDAMVEALAEKLQGDDVSASEAKMKASLIVNLTILGLSLACSVGGLAAGFSASASAAANAANTATAVAKTAKMASDTAKTAQNVIAIASTAVGVGSLASGGVTTYLTKQSEEKKADVTEMEKFVKTLQQRLDESEEELEQLLAQIEAALGEIAETVASATDTSAEIAQNIGQMA